MSRSHRDVIALSLLPSAMSSVTSFQHHPALTMPGLFACPLQWNTSSLPPVTDWSFKTQLDLDPSEAFPDPSVKRFSTRLTFVVTLLKIIITRKKEAQQIERGGQSGMLEQRDTRACGCSKEPIRETDIKQSSPAALRSLKFP